MKFPAMKVSLVLALSATFFLSSCGGGGGSRSPALAPSTITSANSSDVAAQAVAASSSLSNSTSAANFVTGVSVSTNNSGLIDVSLKHMYHALAARTPSLAVGVTTSQTVNCPDGGTETVTVSYADPNTISNGDTVSISANNCTIGTTKINGTMSVQFSKMSGQPDPALPWSATITMRFTNFTFTDGAATQTINGDMTLSLNQTSAGNITFIVSGDSLSVRADQTLSAYRYSGSENSSGLVTYRSDFTLSGNLGNLGYTSYTVKTLTDFEAQGTAYPSKGVLIVTASNNSTLTLTALSSTNVQIAIDTNGDGVIDETKTTTWADLASRL